MRAPPNACVGCIERLDTLPADTDIDAIVHLAGARVLDRRWTAARRATLVRSRDDIAEHVASLARRPSRVPRVLVSASVVSYHGHSGVVPCGQATRLVDPRGGSGGRAEGVAGRRLRVPASEPGRRLEGSEALEASVRQLRVTCRWHLREYPLPGAG